MQRSTVIVVMLVGLFLPTAGRAAQQDVFSNFDNSAEGWSCVNGTQNCSWNGSAGNPPGSLYAEDSPVGGPTWYFSAPSSYLGDLERFYAGFLAFELQVSANNNSGDAAVVMDDGITQLNWGRILPVASDWTSFAAPLSPGAGWTKNAGGAIPTEAEFRAVLRNVTRIWIRGEYQTGADHAYLDNVMLLESRCGHANAVIACTPGNGGTGCATAANAVGTPNHAAISLGWGGVLTLALEHPALDGPSADLVVHEIGNTPENYRLDASEDGLTFFTLGECAGHRCSFDLAGSSLASAIQVRITDLLPNESVSLGDHGADIDAVDVVYCSACGGNIGTVPYGTYLFTPLCTRDAAVLAQDVYSSLSLGLFRGPHDRFFLSSEGNRFVSLAVDDAVHVSGQDSGLGPYSLQTGVPPYRLNVPITDNLQPEPSQDLDTTLISPGKSTVLFELLDTQRAIYGNTAVFLVRDCGIWIDVSEGGQSRLNWVSHDVAVVGLQSDLDIVSGMIMQLRSDHDFSRACFLGSFANTTQVVDSRPAPPTGDGYYYLVSGTCATPIGYGDSSQGPRQGLPPGNACP